MHWETAAELALSVFAVFGAYALFRCFVTARFLPKESGFLLRIGQSTKLAELPALLECAQSAAKWSTGGQVICLLEAGVDEGIAAYLEQVGTTYYKIR